MTDPNDNGVQLGQPRTYEIGGRKLLLKPLPLGRIKKASAVLSGAGETDNFVVISKYILEILSNGENHDLSLEWIEENVTLPDANQMIDDSRRMNGLGSFFQKAPEAKAPEAMQEKRELSEATQIPSA